jgi:hypothetical protein
MNYDYAIHSDFLIHWTGKDIDSVYDQQWYQSDRSRTNKSCDVTDRYIKRLYDILQYGIWMTSENEPPFCFNGTSINLPSTPKSCLTELKLSESRQHARHYGRLGIGFKRPFVFNRLGRPVVYYGFHKDNSRDIFLKQCTQELTDKNLLNFFKPMNSTTILNYDFYSESEWRIIYFESLLKDGLIKDPRDSKNVKEYEYFQKLTADEQNKLKYLIPLDGWFTMIIYPSLNVKNEAQFGSTYKIRSEIERIKNDPNGHAYKVEGVNWPVELNLDACRNF